MINEKAKGKSNIGGIAVPNDMIAKPEKEVPWDPEPTPTTNAGGSGGASITDGAQGATTALAVADEKMIAEIKQLSGSNEGSTVTFPMLKLQHTTDLNGEPNPLRGHFTKVSKNDLGEYVTEDLGDTVKFQFLLRRHFLKMMTKGGDSYTSADFDGPMDTIPLWKRNKDQSEIFAEGTPHDLQAKFLTKDDKGRVRSDLRMLSKLYVMINGEVLVWKLSLTGTIAWSKYTKLIPFAAGVITQAGRTEEKMGTVKYYAPVFKAEERLTDLVAVRDNIQLLIDMLPKKKDDIFTVEDDKDEPFKS